MRFPGWYHQYGEEPPPEIVESDVATAVPNGHSFIVLADTGEQAVVGSRSASDAPLGRARSTVRRRVVDAPDGQGVGASTELAIEWKTPNERLITQLRRIYFAKLMMSPIFTPSIRNILRSYCCR